MIEYFINKYSGDFVSTKMEKELGAEQFQLFKRIQQLKAETGEVKARLPFEFSIH